MLLQSALGVALLVLPCVAIVPEDQSPHCAQWAALGECEGNPTYMTTACARSCALRASANCAAWAKLGECEKNPAVMCKSCMEFCPLLHENAAELKATKVTEAEREVIVEGLKAGNVKVEPNGKVPVEAASSEETVGEIDCSGHPGGCRCYYDALADGCASAVPQGGILALCGCDYRDNSWLRVFTGFYRFFGSSFLERSGIVGTIVEEKGQGVLSMEVGLKDKLECSHQHAAVWPGTVAMLDFDEVGKMVNSIFFGQVQQVLMDICAPGRLLLGVLCLHALLHKGDALAASAYAQAMIGILERIDSCIEGNTPYPKLIGLYRYLQSWNQVQIPGTENPQAVSLTTIQRLSWWPEGLRAKEPGQPGMNLWPCVPMRDILCWAPGSEYNYESCDYCCDPAHGPQGAAMCFDAQFSFERCCRTPDDRGFF